MNEVSSSLLRPLLRLMAVSLRSYTSCCFLFLFMKPRTIHHLGANTNPAPEPGQVAYSASKGAIASLTLPLTRDLARYGIRVVTVAPSLFNSRMTSVMSDKVRGSLLRVMEFPKRPGEAPEFAHLVRTSIENVMLNGVVLRLDGGMRMPSKM